MLRGSLLGQESEGLGRALDGKLAAVLGRGLHAKRVDRALGVLHLHGQYGRDIVDHLAPRAFWQAVRAVSVAR
eukprot:9470394-Pyramimonas_sp.AAC.1